MKPTMNTHDTPRSDDEIDALWAQQERLRKAATAGEPVAEADRRLYTALARMRLPALPDDFASATAALAHRSAEARRRIVRLRGVLLRLFGLLYLPAMLLAALVFAADLPAVWLHADPAQRQPLQWVAVVLLLAVGSTLAARRRRRRDID